MTNKIFITLIIMMKSLMKRMDRYAPSVLLLRRFEALGKSSAAGTSPGDQQGAVSRVTSVLKTNITAHLSRTSSYNCNDMGDWLSDGELVDASPDSNSSTVKVSVSGIVSEAEYNSSAFSRYFNEVFKT